MLKSLLFILINIITTNHFFNKLVILSYFQGKPIAYMTVSPDDVRVGEVATFLCLSSSTTVPDTHTLTIHYSWLVNGQPVETIHQARLVNGQPVETEGRFLETEGGLQETEGRFQVQENKLIISPVWREDKDVIVTCKVKEAMGQTTLANMTVPVLCKSLFLTFKHNLFFTVQRRR